jgi:hypothetical protein
MRLIHLILAATSLTACVALPFLYLHGSVSFADFKLLLAVASVGWFVFATLWVERRKRGQGGVR